MNALHIYAERFYLTFFNATFILSLTKKYNIKERLDNDITLCYQFKTR